MASTSNKIKKETFHNYHRFESRCYETASGFQTVWGPLTQQTNTRKTSSNIYIISVVYRIAVFHVRESFTEHGNLFSPCHSLPLELTKYFSSLEKMRNITTCHLYFLSKILQDSLLTGRLNQAVAAMIGLSGKCEKVVELFCLVCVMVLTH